jgi:hypothetical protein
MTAIDRLIDSLWRSSINSQNSLLHWPMLEAYVAGGSFAIWISLYRVMDRIPLAKHYRFCRQTPTTVAEAVDHDNNGMGQSIEKVDLKEILTQSLDWKSWLPLIVYLLSIHVYHIFVIKAPITTESPTLLRIFVEVFYSIFMYDFIFYFIHRFMHATAHIPWIRECFQHHVHHDPVQISSNKDKMRLNQAARQRGGMIASQVQHHSVVDAFLQVATNIVVQNMTTPWYGRRHSLSRLVHNIVITYMLTEIHAGYDGWWSMHNIFPINILLGGAKNHELHHRYGNGHYQQFFKYLDWIFGTLLDSDCNVKNVRKDE